MPRRNSTGGWTPDPNEWVSLRPTYESPDGEKTELRVRVPRPVRRADEPLDARRARLVWTARKRGILESDLLFSTFATRERLAGMSAAGLAQLDSLMEENDWDLYYWVTGARAAPEEVTRMEFWDELVEHAKNKRREILRMPNL
ncbi:succinate dehydrogenase assembly factor 2 [Cladochytrium tenue]|nr:succinate dehydrogenase assembly factor 2 [Cladochytrium tenue]